MGLLRSPFHWEGGRTGEGRTEGGREGGRRRSRLATTGREEEESKETEDLRTSNPLYSIGSLGVPSTLSRVAARGKHTRPWSRILNGRLWNLLPPGERSVGRPYPVTTTFGILTEVTDLFCHETEGREKKGEEETFPSLFRHSVGGATDRGIVRTRETTTCPPREMSKVTRLNTHHKCLCKPECMRRHGMY